MPNPQIDKVNVNGTTYDIVDSTSGYITSYTETDPVFSASAAAGITSSDITNWNSKTSNTGTVTSVRVQATSPVQSSTNTEQTTSLNTTISLADAYGDTKNPYGSKTKNFVLAAPSTAAGMPSFRALVADDIPDLSGTYLTSYTETDPTVPSWAKASSKPSYTASEVGAVATSAVGAASGVVPLNASSKIDATYLPSYVDDVIEGYYYNNKFYTTSAHTTEITGETGKIYIDLATDKVYRYGGSAYAEIAQGSLVSVSRDLTSGTKIGTITINGTGTDLYAPSNTDENVTNTLSTTTKFYLTGTSSSTTNTGTQYFDTGVYVDTTAGALHATTYNGYTLAAAAAKGVTDNSTSTAASSTDTNLITGRTLYYALQNAGYTTNTGTVTQVTAGTGLKVDSNSSGGNITTSGTINHINSVTAQTTQAVYPIKIDAQGHISAYGTAVTIPAPGLEKTFSEGDYSGYASWFPNEPSLEFQIHDEELAGSTSIVMFPDDLILGSSDNNLDISPQGINFIKYFSGGTVNVSVPLPATSGNYTLALTSDIPTAGTTATAVGTSSSGGSATTWSKSDHVHSISSSTITSALGYTPYNSTNPSGYLTLSTLPIYDGTVV